MSFLIRFVGSALCTAIALFGVWIYACGGDLRTFAITQGYAVEIDRSSIWWIAGVVALVNSIQIVVLDAYRERRLQRQLDNAIRRSWKRMERKCQ